MRLPKSGGSEDTQRSRRPVPRGSRNCKYLATTTTVPELTVFIRKNHPDCVQHTAIVLELLSSVKQLVDVTIVNKMCDDMGVFERIHTFLISGLQRLTLLRAGDSEHIVSQLLRMCDDTLVELTIDCMPLEGSCLLSLKGPLNKLCLRRVQHFNFAKFSLVAAPVSRPAHSAHRRVVQYRCTRLPAKAGRASGRVPTLAGATTAHAPDQGTAAAGQTGRTADAVHHVHRRGQLAEAAAVYRARSSVASAEHRGVQLPRQSTLDAPGDAAAGRAGRRAWCISAASRSPDVVAFNCGGM